MHIYNNSSAPKHSIILIVCFALILHNVSLEKQDFIVMLGVVELTSINQLRSRLVSTSNNWLHKLVCGSSVIVMDIIINSKTIHKLM